MWIGPVQSRHDRNSAVGRGLGHGHRDAQGLARAVPEGRRRQHDVRAGGDCEPDRIWHGFAGKGRVGNEQRTRRAAEQQRGNDDCAYH